MIMLHSQLVAGPAWLAHASSVCNSSLNESKQGYRVRWAGYDENEDTRGPTGNLSCQEFTRSLPLRKEEKSSAWEALRVVVYEGTTSQRWTRCGSPASPSFSSSWLSLSCFG